MENTIRCFIALELTSGIQQQLTDTLKILKASIYEGVKWVPPENIHLTLKFLGDVQVKDINSIQQCLDQAVDGIYPVQISMTGLGAFPGMVKPRVIWVGLKANPIIGSLVDKIGQLTEKAGYPGDAKPFTPHLTIGRTAKLINSRQLTQLSNFLKNNPLNYDMQDTLGIITLFRSSLTPTGAVYTRLYSLNLDDRH